jgi:hypothetical protein
LGDEIELNPVTKRLVTSVRGRTTYRLFEIIGFKKSEFNERIGGCYSMCRQNNTEEETERQNRKSQ